MPPYFSIVMAVQNAMPFLPETLESLWRQTETSFELICVDDQSTDGTWEFLRSQSDSRLRLFRNPKQGQTSALNEGLRYAQAEWVARMDGDDVCVPRRLEEQRKAIEKRHKPPVLISSDYWICNQDLKEVGLVQLAQPNPRLRHYLSTRNNPICHPTVVFRKDAANSVGNYDESLRNAQDMKLWNDLLAIGDWIHISIPLLRYRVRSSSLSVRFQPEQTAERNRILSSAGNASTASTRTATTSESQVIYSYKLGFAAWLAGNRGEMINYLKPCLRPFSGYSLKSATLLVIGIILPRKWAINLAGYRGIFV